VSQTRQHNLVLILARDFASRLATPVILIDAAGDLIYFNEAAEPVLGQPFIEGQRMPVGEWAIAFSPVDDEGHHVPLEELPLGVAFTKRTPAHRALRIIGKDDVPRQLEATAFPLFAHEDTFVGAMAIFWERTEA
jgi:PAS domain-containing protein